MAFKLEIYTPQEKFFDEEVESINLDTIGGKIQILSRHIPVIAGVKPCILKIVQGETLLKFKISDGIMDFEKNNCKIFVSKAEKVEV
ncbi:ATP synthase epsilon chain [Caloramator mitchellensis]|uniref:ATP synthase epsilon chain n=1 Tax=Caloramator mitchellensis TaxID=908809 RepID=A0A0R3JVZ0_CALMK|nr:F0F1 ATP synthase subunit epsilon [Caloramator mitchellensis]KRQ87734.1 ATP synthase epsilon chain [Caloramator mitchellensis]